MSDEERPFGYVNKQHQLDSQRTRYDVENRSQGNSGQARYGEPGPSVTVWFTAIANLARWALLAALAVVSVVLVTDWLYTADPALRATFEAVDPANAIATTPAGTGRPALVAGVVAGLLVVAIIAVLGARRSAAAGATDGGFDKVAGVFGLSALVVALLLLLPALAFHSYGIAGAYDLRESVESRFMGAWQLGLVAATVLLAAWRMTRRTLASARTRVARAQT